MKEQKLDKGVRKGEHLHWKDALQSDWDWGS